MEDIVNININYLVVLLQCLGFQIIYDSDNNCLLKPGDIYLATKKYKIKLEHVQEAADHQNGSLAMPDLKGQQKQLIHEKLAAIFGLMSEEKATESSIKPERSVVRRGSSFNVSRSFTIHHNAEAHGVCTSPLSRCSSPLAARCGRTPLGADRRALSDVLKKARNLIDMAVDMSADPRASNAEMGLNSTFTFVDQPDELLRVKSPRMSGISKVSPLAQEGKSSETEPRLVDITNTSSAGHPAAPAPKKSAHVFSKVLGPQVLQPTDSMEKKVKRPFTKIGILKQPSSAAGVTSIRSSPLGRLKKDRADTPRPLVGTANRCHSTSNLASPYARPPPKATTGSATNTPSPSIARAPGKTAPGFGLRIPGWAKK